MSWQFASELSLTYAMYGVQFLYNPQLLWKFMLSTERLQIPHISAAAAKGFWHLSLYAFALH